MTTDYESSDLGHYDIEIVTHASFVLEITWNDENGAPIDLTGYTARMQARDDEDADTPWFDVDESDYIALGGTAGTISVVIPKSITEDITSEEGVWDLMLTSPAGVTTRVLHGCACVEKGITHD